MSAIGMGDQTDGEAVNLHQFFAHIFDSGGSMVEPSGCDTAYYLSQLDGIEITEAEKTELIHTLWRMMDSVVRMQFGFDSLTHIMNENAAMRAENDLSMVRSSPGLNDKNEGA